MGELPLQVFSEEPGADAGAHPATAQAEAAAKVDGEADSASGRQPRPLFAAGKENCAGAAGGITVPTVGQLAGNAASGTEAQVTTVLANLAGAGGSSPFQHAGTRDSELPGEDDDEPLSQKPLVQIRKQMLQSQQKRARTQQLAQRGVTDGADSQRSLAHQVQLTARAFGQRPEAAFTDGLPDDGAVQQSQVPLAMWASKQAMSAACGGAAAGSECHASVPLSQVPLAVRATTAPGSNSGRTCPATAARHLNAASQAARVLMAQRCGEDDGVASDKLQHAAAIRAADGRSAAATATSAAARLASAIGEANGRPQSWASSAAHLRDRTQRKERLAISGNDEDPTEDLTLHQRQWVASGQKSALHGTSLTALAAMRATGALSPTLPHKAVSREGPATCDPARSSRGLEAHESARAAAEAVVMRLGRTAAAAAAAADRAGCLAALRQLERELCSITERVSRSEPADSIAELLQGPDRDPFVAAPSADATVQHADPSPTLPMRNNGPWLPAPDAVTGCMTDDHWVATPSHHTGPAAHQPGDGAGLETAPQQLRLGNGDQTALQEPTQGIRGASPAVLHALLSQQGGACSAPQTCLTAPEGMRLASGQANGSVTAVMQRDRQREHAGTADIPPAAPMDWSGARRSAKGVHALAFDVSSSRFSCARNVACECLCSDADSTSDHGSGWISTNLRHS